MTAEQAPKGRPASKKEQWEHALNLLYLNFRDYSKEAVRKFGDEDIHQARVNCRKLLTLLAILDPEHSSGLYPIFKKAQKRLGKVRDADVLIQSFKERRQQAEAEGNPKTVRLLTAVIKHQKSIRKKYREQLAQDLPKLANSALDERWSLFLSTQLEDMIARRDANVVMRELEEAFEQKKQACKALFKDLSSPSEEDFETLHKLRIAAKELRYTAGAAAFALNQKFQADEAIYKDVQTQLGEINDKRIWLQTLNAIGRKKLDVGKKTWEAFTAELRVEVLEALQHNHVLPIGDNR
ncbi:CHAD domain-containing protein [Paenibacillus sp. GCM10012306]|uniref:CHAD domain-containing protein n=1 Tax=Paenibacillus sp. GCM10012306 TaxID=3317342 RepID=UPI00360668F4